MYSQLCCEILTLINISWLFQRCSWTVELNQLFVLLFLFRFLSNFVIDKKAKVKQWRVFQGQCIFIFSYPDSKTFPIKQHLRQAL